ncbi:glycosyltransferase family 4 protein [Marimonas sp. MJW-29]|uniref:Glycosyltransferase family 4 protein n=1 Tax=Sulfitobacter sediminis TaxID=3234186 RepID=A0ABV3RMZ0_9RHOB
MYDLSFSPGRTAAKSAAALRATFRRIWALRTFRQYDIIYLQRELLPFGPPVFERLMKALGACLIFDYDDALFIKKPSRYSRLATMFRSPQKALKLFRICDCVVAGNDWLRDKAIEAGGKSMTVEVAEDTDRFRMRPSHTNADEVVIGWLGSKSTVKYLRLIEPVLARISERYPDVRFEIVGGGEFELPGLPVTHTDWSLDGEVDALHRFSIGLMPLPLEEWSRGKSGGKARTYMAAGVPAVCTAVGYNLELIKHGETGFLCTSDREWEEALSKLLEDPKLRQRVAEAARRDVEVRFSPAKQAGLLREVFDNVLSSREGGR